MFHNRHMRRHPEMYGITFVNDVPDDATGGGGAGTALADKPADEDGDNPDDTDGDAKAEDESDGDDKGDDKPEALEIDAETQAVIDARVAERIEQHETEAQQKAREADETKAKNEGIENLRKLRTTRDEEIAGIRLVGKDEDGTEVQYKLPPAIESQLTGILTKHDADLEEHFGVELRDTLRGNSLTLVPEAERDALGSALDGAETYEAHQREFGEAYAKHAKSIKEMGLDDLAALSTKATRELKERELAVRKAGRLQGQDDPVDEPVIDGGTPARRKTYTELQDGYAAGSLTDAEDAAYLAQKAEREKAL